MCSCTATSAARRVGDSSPLGVADLSPRRGGWTSQHNSHQNGRDVDLLFFMAGADGTAMAPAVMARVNREGSAVVLTGPERPRFDVARKPNRHVAFGQGDHVCVGMNVARMEGRIALGRLLERFTRIELAGEPERDRRIRFRGFRKLPVRVG